MGLTLANPTGVVERNRSVPIGEWVTPPYNAGDFTAGGSMTWTVEAADLQGYGYTEIGKTMFFCCNVALTSIGGTASTLLRVKVPNGRVIARVFRTSGRFYSATTGWIGAHVEGGPGGTNIMIYRTDAANFPLETNAINVGFECFFEFE